MVPLVERLAAAGRAGLGRHATSRPWPRRRWRRARRSSTTSPGCATRRWPTCARAPGAALVIMHTRVEPKGTLLDPARYDDVVADVVGLPARADGGARSPPAWGRSRSCSTRARTSPRRPRRRSPCCGGSTRVLALGRPVLLAVSRKDFVGALTGRGPRERGRGDAGGARRTGVDAGAQHPARPRRRRGRRLPRRPGRAARRARARAGRGPHARPLPGAASLLGARLPAAAHNAAGCPPTDTEGKETHMSSVLDRSGLEKSPLADLHLLANELGVDGFRRLRKADLIDAILDRQAGRRRVADAAEDGDDDDADAEDRGRGRPRPREADAPRPPRRPRRGARRDEDDGDDDRGRRRGRRRRAEDEPARGGRGRGRERPTSRARRPRPRRRRRARTRSPRASSSCSPTARASSACAAGEPTDDDVYVSAAQVKRCELVSGDRVAGPVRAPRRSERFPSLVRVDTINGRPPTRSPRAPASRTCPPRSRPSASSSAPRTRPSRRSSG